MQHIIVRVGFCAGNRFPFFGDAVFGEKMEKCC
jgi:hypothetical protein